MFYSKVYKICDKTLDSLMMCFKCTYPRQYICSASGLQDVLHFSINLVMKKNALQFIKPSTCRLLGHAEYAQHFEGLTFVVAATKIPFKMQLKGASMCFGSW